MNRYNNANDKFTEAQTFINKMEKSMEDINQFRGNLSAFLSAARSVMLVWKDDYDADKNSRFGRWFGSLFKEYPILEYLQQTRNANTHEGKLSIEPYGIYSYQIYEITDGKEIYKSSIKAYYGTPEEIDKFLLRNHPESKIKKVPMPKWKFKDFNSNYYHADDVIEVSKGILDKLGFFLLTIKSEFPDICD